MGYKNHTNFVKNIFLLEIMKLEACLGFYTILNRITSWKGKVIKLNQ